MLPVINVDTCPFFGFLGGGTSMALIPGLISKNERDLFQKIFRILICFRLALLHSVTYFNFLYWSLSSSSCMVVDAISTNIDEALSINPPADVFVFKDFKFHHKHWLTYPSGTYRFGELCYNFSISNKLNQIVNFPARIPDCDS